jgi:hypothetical protein
VTAKSETRAAGPALLTPHSQPSQVASEIVARRQAKRLARLREHAATAGVDITETADGRYVIRRWCLTRKLDDLNAVAAWLRSETGRKS